jgi:hypothetical protein
MGPFKEAVLIANGFELGLGDEMIVLAVYLAGAGIAGGV